MIRYGPAAVDDPDVQALLAAHLAFVAPLSPPEDVHALDAGGLGAPEVQLFGAREGGVLLAIGALRWLSPHHIEVKSMHTLAQARGRRLAVGMLRLLLRTATAAGAFQASLETGTAPEFAPARALYLGEGFEPCPPFGDYVESAHSCFFTRSLGD